MRFFPPARSFRASGRPPARRGLSWRPCTRRSRPAGGRRSRSSKRCSHGSPRRRGIGPARSGTRSGGRGRTSAPDSRDTRRSSPAGIRPAGARSSSAAGPAAGPATRWGRKEARSGPTSPGSGPSARGGTSSNPFSSRAPRSRRATSPTWRGRKTGRSFRASWRGRRRRRWCSGTRRGRRPCCLGGVSGTCGGARLRSRPKVWSGTFRRRSSGTSWRSSGRSAESRRPDRVSLTRPKGAGYVRPRPPEVGARVPFRGVRQEEDIF